MTLRTWICAALASTTMLAQAGWSTTLAITAIIKNEAQWLPEWVAYHHMNGVSKFLLYDNGSSDHPERTLAHELESGLVEILPLPNGHNDGTLHWWELSTRIPAYGHALQQLRDYDWVAILDANEFLVPEVGTCLEAVKDFESRYPEAACLHATWRCFGHSGIRDLKKGELLIEHLTQCADPSFIWEHEGKCIVRPQCVVEVETAESVSTGDRPQMFFSGMPYLNPDQGDRTGLQINRYVVRTIHFMEEQLRSTTLGYSGYSLGVWRRLGRDCNADTRGDYRIQRFVPLLKASMLAHRI